MLWVYNTAAAVNESGFEKEVAAVLDKALRLKYRSLALSCLAQFRGNVLKYGCMVAEGFAEHMQARTKVLTASNQSDALSFRTLNDLEDFMLSTFPAEVASKEEPDRWLWNNIFNAAVEPIDNPDSDGGMARYTQKINC